MPSQGQFRRRSINVVLNNPTPEELVLIEKWLVTDEVQRAIMCREHWTGGGTPHLHIVVQFDGQKVVNAAFKAGRGIGRANVEAVQSWKASVMYCRKTGEGQEPHKPEWGEAVVFEKGDLEKAQGKRSDLDGPCELVMSGGTLREVAREYPTVYVRYARGLQSLVSLQLEPRRLAMMPRVLTLWGSTGQGKSGRAQTFADRNGPMYTKHGATDHWWDGYQGEKIILLEEFRGGMMKRSDLLSLIDVYGCRRPVKGAMTEIQADTFLICGPDAPVQWYRDDWDAGDQASQLERRLLTRGHPDSRIYNVDRKECTDFEGKRLEPQPVRGSMLDGVMRDDSDDE